MVSFTWHPIEDLPDDWQKLASSELAGLLHVWREQRERLESREGVRRFNEQLRREWAIETGIIENLYSIDRGTTTMLIERGLEASLIAHGSTDKAPEYVVSLIRDQEDALEGLFTFINQQRTLSTSYIKELHAAITRHQTTVKSIDGLGRPCEVELIRGDYKRSPNNPTRSEDSLLHEYCSPDHVAAEMDRLVKMHEEHLAAGVSPEVEAAWLHHRFTQIHPFQDGNGRIARLIASLIFLRQGGFPVVITRDTRAKYIDACEKADLGYLSPMIELFVDAQVTAIRDAIYHADNILQKNSSISQIIDAAIDRMNEQPLEVEEPDVMSVINTANQVFQYSSKRLTSVADELQSRLNTAGKSCDISVEISPAVTDYNYYLFQVLVAAAKYGYYANTDTFDAMIKLKIRQKTDANIVLSFHSVSTSFVGIISSIAILFHMTQDGGYSIGDPIVICDQPFEFSYSETIDEVSKRYNTWLEHVIITGLDQWRRSL
jgi:Fic family protein